jgi:hypothetical protein
MQAGKQNRNTPEVCVRPEILGPQKRIFADLRKFGGGVHPHYEETFPHSDISAPESSA